MKGLQTSGDRNSPSDRNFGIFQPLAESVILQAMEDLWSSRDRKESVEFFQGSGFGLYATVAGMDPCDKLFLLCIIKRALRLQVNDGQSSSINLSIKRPDRTEGKFK